MNKNFEAMNAAGVQLEQYEIVKQELHYSFPADIEWSIIDETQ